MDTIPPKCHNSDNYILKTNLWKFFKIMRAQANQIYSLLVASPINYAWITIIDKSDPTIQKRISISAFVRLLKKLPSTGKYYRLSINLWSLVDRESQGKFTYNIIHYRDLSIKMLTNVLPNMVAYHCAEAIKRGERFELTPQNIARYKIKSRYLNELHQIIAQCNSAITIDQKNNILYLLKSNKQ